jgi:putative sigma-54 modulation protein
MGIAITFRHMASSDAVRDYVHEKLERVQKYLRQPLDAHVTFSTERHQHLAEILVNSVGRQYQAHSESDDMYKSIDLMIDKIEHQIAKHHDTQARNKKGAEAARNLAPQPDFGEPDAE